MKTEFLSNSTAQTKRLGKVLAKEALKTVTKTALVFGLEGDLGGGKTTFLQGFAKGLGVREKILSPTFIILRRFKIKVSRLQPTHRVLPPSVGPFKNFYHIDCYRIQKPKELLGLGFKEIISNPQNIIAMEWADRVKPIMPPQTIWIKFEFIDEKKRKIVVKCR